MTIKTAIKRAKIEEREKILKNLPQERWVAASKLGGDIIESRIFCQGFNTCLEIVRKRILGKKYDN